MILLTLERDWLFQTFDYYFPNSNLPLQIVKWRFVRLNWKCPKHCKFLRKIMDPRQNRKSWYLLNCDIISSEVQSIFLNFVCLQCRSCSHRRETCWRKIGLNCSPSDGWINLSALHNASSGKRYKSAAAVFYPTSGAWANMNLKGTQHTQREPLSVL
jgi:hypothetical protein